MYRKKITTVNGTDINNNIHGGNTYCTESGGKDDDQVYYSEDAMVEAGLLCLNTPGLNVLFFIFWNPSRYTIA